MDWYHGDVGTSDPKTASGGNAASGRKWCRRLGRKNEWFCPQDAAVPDFSRNLTQRPHSLCFIDQHKEWGVIGAGDKVLCACLRPGSVLQGCHEGAMMVLPACCDGAIQVHAWCLHRENAASPAAMPDQGDITVPYACALGGSMVLPWCAATVGQSNIKVS